MRWYLLVAALGLSQFQTAIFSQEPPGDQRLAPVSDPPSFSGYTESGYFSSTGFVRFQLIQGRLQLDSPRHRKGAQQQREGKVYESITVTASLGKPSLHYVLQTPRQDLTLSVQQASRVRIESLLHRTGERAILDQIAMDEIS